MVKINWTFEAVQWLEDIHEYISRDKPNAARQVITGIYDKVQSLTKYPELGYRYKNGKEGEIRILLFGHYRIAYLIKTDNQIDILGVFHDALDMEQYLI